MNHLIPLPDDLYAELAQIADRAGQPLDALVADMLKSGLQQPTHLPGSKKPEQTDPMLDIMRANGHLVPSENYAQFAGATTVPPAGSSEQDALLEEIGEELSDALDHVGLSVAELVER